MGFSEKNKCNLATILISANVIGFLIAIMAIVSKLFIAETLLLACSLFAVSLACIYLISYDQPAKFRFFRTYEDLR